MCIIRVSAVSGRVWSPTRISFVSSKVLRPMACCVVMPVHFSQPTLVPCLLSAGPQLCHSPEIPATSKLYDRVIIYNRGCATGLSQRDRRGSGQKTETQLQATSSASVVVVVVVGEVAVMVAEVVVVVEVAVVAAEVAVMVTEVVV